jgi:hypothetical protein
MNTNIVLLAPIIVALLGAIPSAMAQQSGYSLTVNIPSHPFGKDSVHIFIQTENGYNTYQWVSTAGGASWTFNVPPDQGNTVKVCASTDSAAILLGLDHCQIYSVLPCDPSLPCRHHVTVSLDAN